MSSSLHSLQDDSDDDNNSGTNGDASDGGASDIEIDGHKVRSRTKLSGPQWVEKLEKSTYCDDHKRCCVKRANGCIPLYKDDFGAWSIYLVFFLSMLLPLPNSPDSDCMNRKKGIPLPPHHLPSSSSPLRLPTPRRRQSRLPRLTPLLLIHTLPFLHLISLIHMHHTHHTMHILRHRHSGPPLYHLRQHADIPTTLIYQALLLMKKISLCFPCFLCGFQS